MNNFRTDLALESRDFYLKSIKNTELDGISYETTKTDLFTVTKVKIENEAASIKLKKPIGNYITIHSSHIMSGLYTKELSEELARQLTLIMPPRSKKSLVFAAGLGNDNVTPDSIGPKVVSSLVVTRHILGEENFEADLSPLCALAPGVLGITGIETAEIFSSVSNAIKPDFVIAIDALASRSSKHVGTTIQIADTGINPGSGVHNRRNALNKKTIGVPVIVVGVPTVSDASAVVYDAIDEILSKYEISSDMMQCENVINDVLTRRAESMMVTPKNIDAITDRASLILSRGINMAVHKDLSYEEICQYTS